jgi:hypothetical protein
MATKMTAAEMAATAMTAAAVAAATAADLNHQVIRRRCRRRRKSGIDGRHRVRALARHSRQREHRSRCKAKAADVARC